MAKKKFVLRLDEEVLSSLEKWAADEIRSVNGQMEWLLAQSLRAAGRFPKRIAADAATAGPGPEPAAETDGPASTEAEK